jgi:peroxin-5
MDLLKNLLGDTSCNVDGTVAASNPVSSIMDSLFDTNMFADGGFRTESTTGSSIQAGSSITYMDDPLSMHMQGMHGMQGIQSADQGSMQGVWDNCGGGMQQMQPGGMIGMAGPGMMQMQMQMASQMSQMAQMQQMQAMQQQQMQMQAMYEQQQYEMQQNLENTQHEHIHTEAQNISVEEALEGMTITDDMNAAELEEIWEQFQQEQQPQAQNTNEGMDTAWQNIQEKMEAAAHANTNVYDFQTQNQFLAAHQAAQTALAAATYRSTVDDAASFFDEGMRMFNDGDIKNAILAFEASAQIDVEHDESWRMLGMCHAENDMDKEAIVCLKKAVQCDPYNTEALLALGTSYVNEMDSAGALSVLKEWVLHHPSFCGLTPAKDEYSDDTLMDEVMQLILAAHNHAPQDVDVKVLLGVLYNVSQNFDQAAELFRDALKHRPNDYTLFNKLGATLANSNGSEAAIPLYEKAVEIRPSYARGWLNKGISYANLNQYEEAARSYVKALDLNAQGKHMWGYLRVVFTCMNDLELVELCGREDLNTIASKLGVTLSSSTYAATASEKG